MPYILALDQGTTSSRAIVFDGSGSIVSSSHDEFRQIFPKAGWVEHDPEEIWSSQQTVAREALKSAGISAPDIAAIGITNQRETAVVWDRFTGEPVCNAIVWQDRRTSNFCDELKRAGHEDLIRDRTGLVIDAYFSGTKIRWILNNVEGARQRAEAGDLAFGTVDSWLIFKMTGGASHVTDATNASRTLLYNIREHRWDDELLTLPRSMLPEVHSSSEVYAQTKDDFLGVPVPIAGIAGDQQAALFGQICTEPGMVKNTYGTGCFMLMNTGTEPVASANNLVTTIAWDIDGVVDYALEGSIFVAGAAVQWLRDGLNLISDSSEIESLAQKVDSSEGVYFVPAFTGLGAPHWDDLRVDGGATVNDLMMQFQSDLLGVPVVRPVVRETTALGAAYLAGLAVGYWNSVEEISRQWSVERRFEPSMEREEAARHLAGWERAIERAKHWEEADE